MQEENENLQGVPTTASDSSSQTPGWQSVSCQDSIPSPGAFRADLNSTDRKAAHGDTDQRQHPKNYSSRPGWFSQTHYCVVTRFVPCTLLKT